MGEVMTYFLTLHDMHETGTLFRTLVVGVVEGPRGRCGACPDIVDY